MRTPTDAETAGCFCKMLNISNNRIGSTPRNPVCESLSAKHLAHAEKHVLRLDTVLTKLQAGVDKASVNRFQGSIGNTHLSAVADKLMSLRNLWASGQLSGTHRWVRIGAPIIHWQRASGERLVAKALASLEKIAKKDASGFSDQSGAAFDYYMDLGSLHKMKL